MVYLQLSITYMVYYHDSKKVILLLRCPLFLLHCEQIYANIILNIIFLPFPFSFFFYFLNSVHAVTGQRKARGRVCDGIPGSGGKVREPWGIHTGTDETASVMEAADHPRVAPSASQDQGQPPHPSVSLQIMMMMNHACFFSFLLEIIWNNFLKILV